MPTTTRRRSTRLRRNETEEENDENKKQNGKNTKNVNKNYKDDDDDDDDDDDEDIVYHFNGVDYKTYQEMVQAKRNRNQEMLKESGLLTAIEQVKDVNTNKKPTNSNGLQKRKSSKSPSEPLKRRKSNRLQGKKADSMYVDDEKGGKFTVIGKSSSNNEDSTSTENNVVSYYRNRINDGSPLSIQQAIDETGPKWVSDDSVQNAKSFIQNVLLVKHNENTIPEKEKKSTASNNNSPTSVITKHVDTINTNDATTLIQNISPVNDENAVAKVCPDRIYSMAIHNSLNDVIVAAGDKVGYVGLWNVNSNNDNDGVYLFKPHTGAVSCLQWNDNNNKLMSASYDGTIRIFDPNKEQFNEIFATYDDDIKYKNKLGYNIDTTYNFWTQYACIDHRNQNCYFISTSIGTALHIDLRTRNNITFHEQLSIKKINTLSLHPNGYSLVSAGLDCTVSLWDIRKFSNNTMNKTMKLKTGIATYYNGGRSVNSAYFSSSGKYLISTTMANKLDTFENFHTTNTKKCKPQNSIYHDNNTGRWLTTFHGIFHPTIENVFAIGSMSKPRCVDFYNPNNMNECHYPKSGDALTAVVSRLAFHPRSDKIILAGGSSSGRVTIFQ